MARCLDDAHFLSRLLDRINIDEMAVHLSDVAYLAESLVALSLRMQTLFHPGKTANEGGDIVD
jgi:hypothetical protein